MNLPPYELITTPAQWRQCLCRLHQEPRLAVDLEANSMYAYYEQICLVQISIPGQDYIVDPLGQVELKLLGEIIEDPTIEKVFHAAEYDLILMRKQYGWELRNLFDTMWAARILGYRQMGLASLLQKHFQVHQNKKHQRANWCKRPLTREQMTYAQRDSHYLLALREVLFQALRDANRLDEAEEIFTEHSRVKIPDQTFDPESFWSINGARDLEPQQQAVLKAVHVFRNSEAERRNRPLYRIFGDRTALELAQVMPGNTNELQQVYGMSPGQIRRYGRSLLKVIQSAQAERPPQPPKRNKRPPEAVLQRYDKLYRWRKKQAARRGVESDVILSRETLWLLAQMNPRTTAELAGIDGIGPWRQNQYGEAIMKALQR